MTDIESGEVRLSLDGGVWHIQLHRPARKNALSLQMYQQLGDAVREGSNNPDVRVLLISGGEGCFTSGNDLGDFLKHKGNLSEEDNPTPKFMQALIHCDKPVVAAVTGPAVGIGTTMLLHCDLIYAADDAFFQLPFVNLGVCPEFSSSVILPKLMGHPKAAELLYLGERFSAEVAKEVGIVNHVVVNDLLMSTANDVCRKLAVKPASALRATKQLLKKELREFAPIAMQNETGFFKQGLQSPEFAEAVAAFIEKREPNFTQFN